MIGDSAIDLRLAVARPSLPGFRPSRFRVHISTGRAPISGRISMGMGLPAPGGDETRYRVQGSCDSLGVADRGCFRGAGMFSPF